MIKIRTSSGKWESFCGQIETFLAADFTEQRIDGRTVRGYRSPDSPALWIRDHSDIVRAGKYFESDLKSAVECFAHFQARDGRLFDHVLTSPLKGSSEQENWEKWVRVPVEADVEFRFVKAVHQAWQASGDLKWLKRYLPACDQALMYSLQHPWRWDKENQLVKRPYTIDTWDFDYTAGRAPWLNFQIDDHTFWGITHADNSGVYEAAQILANWYALTGDAQAEEKWRRKAEGIRKRANDLLFNGAFYTHFHKLTPVTIPGVDEASQLSLSTPMAINRGLATHEFAVSILQEYQRRRKSTDAFAEWFGIDPPFPDGIFGDEKLVGGAYINGGIFPLVGGELARAAFTHGFEDYGISILEQYREMIHESNATYLWYFPDGTASSEETSTSPEALPTDGWGSSAMLYGFVEGLCGVVDEGAGFESVSCTPRWAATDEKEIEIEISYAASGATFGYRYQHDAEQKEIHFSGNFAKSSVRLSLLIPEGAVLRHARRDGQDVPAQVSHIEGSTYVDFESPFSGDVSLNIRYA